MPCWECKSDGPTHDHHVIPKSKGGKRTLPLCESCHSKVHGHDLNISRLVKDAMSKRAAKGLRISGAAPYGYRHTPDGRTVPDPSEQATIRLAEVLRRAGYSYQRIADAVYAQGHTNRQGAKIHPSTIRKFLLSRGTHDTN